MESNKSISGFSKLSKRKKIKWIVENFFKDPENVMRELTDYWYKNEDQQKILDGFSENTISNFPMPFSVAPNFLINGKTYCVPMVIEESSVVAAASAAAKFWMKRGGFTTTVIDTVKIGQVHFTWQGDRNLFTKYFDDLKSEMLENAKSFTQKMEQRGGGIIDVSLEDLSDKIPNYFQLKCSFQTCDSMGANFINSILENFALTMKAFFNKEKELNSDHLEVIMCILSNYTPDCLVRAEVSCPVRELGVFPDQLSAEEFAHRFATAINIGHVDPYRATTNNKGIFNGIDAVVLATGNDFRAIESCGHTFAAKDGVYKSLSSCEVKDGQFKFWLDVPLAVGTVGGLTSLHPIAKRSLELLGNPGAEELMCIIAATGLAQNFAAVRSLVTTGIQKGHMKMHLVNILRQMEATEIEIKSAVEYFKNEVVSFKAVREFLDDSRKASLNLS